MQKLPFGSYGYNSFKGEDFLEIDQSETRIAYGGLFAYRSGRDEQSS
jgi:hypothetical protein